MKRLLFILILPLLVCCQNRIKIPVLINFSESSTKAITVSESQITDINVYLFSQEGALVSYSYVDHDVSSIPLVLWKDKSYKLYVIANIGISKKYTSEDEIMDASFSIDDISEMSDSRGGVIMCGKENLVIDDQSDEIEISLERAYSRIDLKLDLSSFTGNSFVVKKVSLRNVPRTIKLFGENTINDATHLLAEGDSRTGVELTGIESGYLHFYTYENMQGDLLPLNSDPSTKVLTNHPSEPYCTYIELIASYDSEELYGDVTYRLYPGENNTTNFDIRRNTNYLLTISPLGDGLGTLNWRIDDSLLKDYVRTITLSPSEYTFTGHNQTTELTASFFPTSAADKRIVWSSSDPDVATVSQEGIVTSHSDGRCTITATSQDGGNARGTAEITVTSPIPDIRLDKSEITVFKWEQDTISISYLYPDDAVISWSIYPTFSAHIKYLEETRQFVVTGRDPGTARLIVTTDDNVSTVCTINTIIPSADINITSYTAYVGEQIKLELSNIIPPDGMITWASESSPYVGMGLDGTATAYKPGTSRIYAMVNGGVVALCTITVIPLQVVFDESLLDTYQGFNDTLSYHITPERASSLRLRWETEDGDSSYLIFPSTEESVVVRGGDLFHPIGTTSRIKVSFVDNTIASPCYLEFNNHPALSPETNIPLVWDIDDVIPASERALYDAVEAKRPTVKAHRRANVYFRNTLPSGVRPSISYTGMIYAPNASGDFTMEAFTTGDDGREYSADFIVRIYQIVNVTQLFTFASIVDYIEDDIICSYTRSISYSTHSSNTIIGNSNLIDSYSGLSVEVPEYPVTFSDIKTNNSINYVTLDSRFEAVEPASAPYPLSLRGALRINQHYINATHSYLGSIPIYLTSTLTF